ncbi:MAG: alcohol dehydrogenase catalytic domain-containing protein [Methanocella sp.]
MAAEGQMLAAVFKGEGVLALEERPIPVVAGPDDVLLEVEAAAICGTDIHITEVPPGHPATPGAILCHEYVGRVVAAGDGVTNLQPGDRVVVDPNLTCGRCPSCQDGRPNMCANMTTLGIFRDGGFARYNVVPSRALYRISQKVPPEIAVFAEPLSCIVNGTQKVKPQPGDLAVVLGAGPIGLLFTEVIKAAGARVLAVEPNAFRRSYATKAGADWAVDPSATDVADVLRDLGREGADLVVDAVGSLLPEAVRLVRRGGQVLVFGMNGNAAPPLRQYDITRKEVVIRGTYISHFSFPRVVQILESGVLNLEPLITHQLALTDLPAGFAAMRAGEAVKVVVTSF